MQEVKQSNLYTHGSPIRECWDLGFKVEESCQGTTLVEAKRHPASYFMPPRELGSLSLKHVGHPVVEGVGTEEHCYSGQSLWIRLPKKGFFLVLVFFKKKLQPRNTNTWTEVCLGKQSHRAIWRELEASWPGGRARALSSALWNLKVSMNIYEVRVIFVPKLW